MQFWGRGKLYEVFGEKHNTIIYSLPSLNRIYSFLLLLPYIFYNLFFQNRKVVLNNIPHNSIVNLEIFMNNIVSHSINLFPGRIGMSYTKFFCKHIRGFAQNFNVLYNGIVHHIISNKIIKGFSFGVTIYSFYCLKYMLKSDFISATFSHTQEFYLVRLTL